ncbi:MAG: methyltransferase domain-containing protein [Sumerlaeia bacterium]
MSEELYHTPDLYELALGAEADGEEVAFYARWLARGPGAERVLSLGCGGGRLEAPLARLGVRFVGVDAAAEMVALAGGRDPGGLYLRGDMARGAVRGPFAGAISGLLSFAYLTRRGEAEACLRWVAETLAAGAPLLLDVPLSHRPRRLQGVEESLAGEGWTYRFRYLDWERSLPAGEVLHTRIEVEAGGRLVRRDAPLLVFTPEGARRLLEMCGFGDVRFFAPHDAESGSEEPPEGCLRGVVVGRRFLAADECG